MRPSIFELFSKIKPLKVCVITILHSYNMQLAIVSSNFGISMDQSDYSNFSGDNQNNLYTYHVYKEG